MNIPEDDYQPRFNKQKQPKFGGEDASPQTHEESLLYSTSSLPKNKTLSVLEEQEEEYDFSEQESNFDPEE